MAHHKLALSPAHLSIRYEAAGSARDDQALVSIYPSSIASGAASIIVNDSPAVLLTLDDVVALRDHLNVCIEQAGSAPFTVVENLVATITTTGDAYRITLPDGRSGVLREGRGELAGLIDDQEYT